MSQNGWVMVPPGDPNDVESDGEGEREGANLVISRGGFGYGYNDVSDPELSDTPTMQRVTIAPLSDTTSDILETSSGFARRRSDFGYDSSTPSPPRHSTPRMATFNPFSILDDPGPPQAIITSPSPNAPLRVNLERQQGPAEPSTSGALRVELPHIKHTKQGKRRRNALPRARRVGGPMTRSQRARDEEKRPQGDFPMAHAPYSTAGWMNPMRWPRNDKNSCYLDSTLMALLLPNNTLLAMHTVHRPLHERHSQSSLVFGNSGPRGDLIVRRRVQALVRKLRTRLHRDKVRTDATKLVGDIRRIVSGGKFTSRVSTGNPEDAAEVAGQLFDILELQHDVNQLEECIVGSNELLVSSDQVIQKGMVTTRRTTGASVLWTVSSCRGKKTTAELLNVTEDAVLDTPYRAKDPAGVEHHFSRRVSVLRYIPSTVFVLHLDRGRIKRCGIPIDDSVSVNGRVFNLVSIVCLEGGHYTAFIRMGSVHPSGEVEVAAKQWAFYNDTSPTPLVPITHPSQMHRVSTTAVLLVYAS